MAKKNNGFLSSSLLKIIAMTAMVIDHYSVMFLGGGTATVWRCIGRIAFPIFAFLIAEGAARTKNKLKYVLRLSLFALLSEIPYDYCFTGNILEFENQNVFFTLALGLLSVLILMKLEEKRLSFLAIFSTILFACAAMYLKSDYGFMGVVVITLMYVFSSTKSPARFAGILVTCLISTLTITPAGVGLAFKQIYAGFAVVPICLYNGKKGFKVNKYLFYAFYPAHILILYVIKMLIAM